MSLTTTTITIIIIIIHDRMCAQLHLKISKEVGVQLGKEQWYEHVPKSVQTCQESKTRKPKEQALTISQTS
jgi:hypothetical protein